MALPEGPYGVVGRYLAGFAPQANVPVVSGSDGVAVAISGRMVGNPLIPFTWLYGPPEPARALVEGLAERQPDAVLVHSPELDVLVHLPELDDVVRSALPDRPRSTDRMLVHDGPGAADPDVVWWDAPGMAVHPSIADKVAPPSFFERIGFRFAGLRIDGLVVSLLDVTVDDGVHALVQQVHTAPALQGRGLARRVLGAAVASLRSRGRVPVYVVSDDNGPSLALARAAGFREVHALTLVLPRSQPG